MKILFFKYRIAWFDIERCDKIYFGDWISFKKKVEYAVKKGNEKYPILHHYLQFKFSIHIIE